MTKNLPIIESKTSNNIKIERIRIVICFLFLIGVICWNQNQVRHIKTVVIANPWLRISVEFDLEKQTSVDITHSDLICLETLEEFEPIKINLNGFEYATNLTHLYIHLNPISDLSPVRELTNCLVLYLHYYRKISDIIPERNLTNLTRSSLIGNIISVMSPLREFIHPQYQIIGYNNKVEISPINELIDNLEEIDNNSHTEPNTIILQTINIPDPNLRAAITSSLGKAPSDTITQVDMTGLEVLNAFDSEITDLTGLEYAINLTELHLGLNHISDISPLKSLTNLEILDLHRNGGLFDISPIKNIKNLLWLSLRGNSIRDISPLKELTLLRYLHVAYNKISDVTPLSELINLTYLDFEQNRVSDLSPLNNLRKLNYLDFDSNQVSDISPIKEHIHLNALDASDNQIVDIYPLIDMIDLEVLDLDSNRISDISPLKDMVNMKSLDLHENRISDISPLKNMVDILELDLDDNQISDISPLKSMIRLSIMLDLDGNQIVDLSPLENLVNLIQLDLDGNCISDITPLSKMVKLLALDLHDNQISDVTPLENLINLRVLDLDDNEITDVTPLSRMTKLKILDLDGNRIIDVTPLSGMTELTVLDLHDNHISDFSPIAGLIDNLMDYDASAQTKPPPNLWIGPTISLADVNRDGIVNINDLILIASNIQEHDLKTLAKASIYPDVNNDGYVDIIDLLIASSEIGTDSAAPSLSIDSIDTSNLTVINLAQWILCAEQLDRDNPQILKGITVLEHLLKLITGREEKPKKTALLPSFPNPFNPETWIPYQLAKPATVSISIIAADGKLVRTIQLGHLPVGTYRSKSRAAYWDGRNSMGEEVASGVYFLTLTADELSATGKVLLRK